MLFNDGVVGYHICHVGSHSLCQDLVGHYRVLAVHAGIQESIVQAGRFLWACLEDCLSVGEPALAGQALEQHDPAGTLLRHTEECLEEVLPATAQRCLCDEPPGTHVRQDINISQVVLEEVQHRHVRIASRQRSLSVHVDQACCNLGQRALLEMLDHGVCQGLVTLGTRNKRGCLEQILANASLLHRLLKDPMGIMSRASIADEHPV
mmetsp:Transcript_25252/g.57308  ORF Transcript_25252/g.57308 Transcript_25252/m.57308 type:complete len:207 (+) Transcript_25252:1717-2337(+)